MSSNIDNGLSQLFGLFQSFSNTFGNDSSVYDDPVSDSLASTLSLSLSPHQAFWKTPPPKRGAFHNLVNRLSDQRRSQPPSEESRFPISEMYCRSQSTIAAVSEGLVEGMLSSDEFIDSGPCGREFLELEEYCIYGSICLESCFIYCTPPNPHVTIITIQPQHGRPGRLVLTELYTLMYWARRYAKRGKKFTFLPLRVVSICENKARFLSANFNQGYLRYLAKIKAIKGLPVTADINVGPYYDMDKPDDFRQFMRKLADVPICPPVVLRVGQITGPVAAPDVWNRDKWFPSLIKTSHFLGYLPDHVPSADWIPVYSVAAIIQDIVHFAATTDKTCTYNILNPHATAWLSLLETVRKRLDSRIQVAELRDWIKMLERIDMTDTKELTAKPAVKILDFYRALDEQREEGGGGLQFSTAQAIPASETMAQLEPVSEDWMEIWLTQWGY